MTLARATVTEQMAQLLRDIHASMLEKWVSLFFPTFSVLTELIFGFFLLFFAFAQRHQSAERAQEDHPRLQRLHSGAGQEERHPGALLRRQDVRGQDQEGVDAVIRSSSTRHWLVGHQFLFMLFFFSFRRDDGGEPGAPAMGAKSLCIPLEQPRQLEADTACIYPGCCNKPKFYCLFGRSY